MAYHFKNLVFEGGGVKGIAYVGAIQVLDKKEILKKIVRVGGTSAGAINAILFALNYSSKETGDILKNLNFRRFMDDSWWIIRDTDRLISKYGWYKGDFFRNWIAEKIEAKTGNSELTFSGLEAFKKKNPNKGIRDIYFMGTNLSTRFGEVFSAEHTPRMCIADAVRISMSIPLFFAAKTSPRGDVYVDGGVLNNYPIKLFDRKKYVDRHSREPAYYKKHNAELKRKRRNISPYVFNKETLGFRLDSAKEIAVFRDQAEPERHKIDHFIDYSWALVSAFLESQQNQHLHGDDWQRTIYIDSLGVSTTDFDLDDQTKGALIKSGVDHTKSYFKWFDDLQSDLAINHPQSNK